LATDYTLLAHLAATFDQEVSDNCMLIRTSRIVKIFVWSDVATFFLQSSGGGLTATKNVNLANLGNKVGAAAQKIARHQQLSDQAASSQ
jgi:hypothetical protein